MAGDVASRADVSDCSEIENYSPSNTCISVTKSKISLIFTGSRSSWPIRKQSNLQPCGNSCQNTSSLRRTSVIRSPTGVVNGHGAEDESVLD